MARFTIGIPTYNRSHFLRRALQSAVNQTETDVEVLVVDNASTDDTEAVVRSFGDRVRYHRNPENFGMWRNLALTPELASGEYFSWLQDDDYIHADFVRKALCGLSSQTDNVMYISWAAYSPSISALRKWTTIHGPDVPVDWMTGASRVIDGLVLVPLSYFESQALPPAVAFRTDAARRGVKELLPDCLLFNEQVVVAAVAALGNVVIDPWIGAIHFQHSQQGHLTEAHGYDELLAQKLSHARFCQRHMSTLPDRWRTLFQDLLRELPVENIIKLYHNVNLSNSGEIWSLAPPVVSEMRDILLASVPAETRAQLKSATAPPPHPAKRWAKQALPGRFRKTLKAARRAWREA